MEKPEKFHWAEVAGMLKSSLTKLNSKFFTTTFFLGKQTQEASHVSISGVWGQELYDICLCDTTGYYSSCLKQEKDNKRLVNQLNHNPLSVCL